MASIKLEILCDGCNAPLGATLSLGQVYVIECGACRDKAVEEARETGIEEGRQVGYDEGLAVGHQEGRREAFLEQKRAA